MALIKCPECGKDVSDKADVCPHCGVSLVQDEIKCPECGTKIEDGEEACSKCGCPVDGRVAKNKENGGVFGVLDQLTGAKNTKSIIKFKDLFNKGFEKHSREEMDEIFTAGGPKTTPDITKIDPKKVGAWAYLRIFALFAVSVFLFHLLVSNFKNSNSIPGLILMGAFGVPVTILIFFYEIDLPHRIPFYRVIYYFLLGGVLSLLVTLLEYNVFKLNFSSLDFGTAMLVGAVEEIAKVVIVAAFLFREKKADFILDGLLIGAAVGAGFAAFETAGYILNYGTSMNDLMYVLFLRAVLAPGGHVAWAALEGAGLMYVKGFINKLKSDHVTSSKFIIIVLVSIFLHGLWDCPWISWFKWEATMEWFVPMILIIIVWTVLFYFVNLGLRQIEAAKQYYLKQAATTMVAKPVAKKTEVKK